MKLVFDLDDTLYDLSEPFRRAHHDVFASLIGEECSELFRMSRIYSDQILDLERAGVIAPEDSLYHRIKRTYADAGLDVDRETADRFGEKYRYYQMHITVPAEIEIMLDRCKSAGYDMYILSNGRIQGQGNKIHALQMERWFDENHIFISEMTGYHKPDIEVFRYVEEKLQAESKDIWYVGDTYEADVLGGKRAGWHVIWFNHRKRMMPEEKNMADETVYTVKELWNTIQAVTD